MNRKRGLALLLVAILGGLYAGTMAVGVITGDPAEYTLVSDVLGVAHPPGYAFMTLVGKLFQTAIPVGTVVWRTHLVAVTAGILASFFVYGTIRAIKPDGWHGLLAALCGGLSVGTAVNHWQHSIHTNPHIVTATFIAFNLFVLTRWYIRRDDGWLYAFCVAAGLGLTHHPLTAFALPACAVFVLVVEPRIVLRWKTLLIGTVFVALGLLPWLYFPLRAPYLAGTLFSDVSNANTVDGFLDIVLARQLRQNLDNLSYFGWVDQPQRFVVFVSLLRLQYTLPVIGLAIYGAWRLAVSKTRPLLLLYLGVFGSLYAFVINTVQDVMAYLLAPFLIVGLLAGIGILFLPQRRERREVNGILIGLCFLFGMGWNVWGNLPVISLRDEREGGEYVELIHETFDGTAANATLISDWERATVLWVHQFVDGGVFDAADVVPLKVDPGKWREMVCAHIGDGAVYLNRYQQSVKGFATGEPCAEFNFRLRTRGALTEVTYYNGEANVPLELTRVGMAGGGVELLGYTIDREGAAGERHQLTVGMSVPEATDNSYFPILTVGDMTFSFTDDSHHLSNSWYVDEVIVAGYQFVLPHRLAAGNYPISLTIHERMGDRPTGIALNLGEMTVDAAERIPETDDLLVNFQHRVGLEKAVAWEGGRHHASWSDAGEPIVVDSGDTIDLYLYWRVLDYAESPYKLFLHLSNPATFQPVRAYDDIPMGGAMPSHLWFPKWLPGQEMVDPYRITTDGVPAGEYIIVAGMTDFFTEQRLMIYAENGDLNGDQVVFGRVIVR